MEFSAFFFYTVQILFRKLSEMFTRVVMFLIGIPAFLNLIAALFYSVLRSLWIPGHCAPCMVVRVESTRAKMKETPDLITMLRWYFTI
jgi:hypothetical protein